MAILHLARGDVDRASRTMRKALEEPPEWTSWEARLNSELGRALLLPVQVEVELAAGDSTSPEAATRELEELATRYPAMRAAATHARGRIHLARVRALRGTARGSPPCDSVRTTRCCGLGADGPQDVVVARWYRIPDSA